MIHYVSIIVPIYDADQTLHNCLNSIVQQTYRHLEIILIDDGSTDDSLHICQQFAKHDQRIKIITQQNGGPSSARNRGIDCATGTYIQFVDADDVLDYSMTEQLIRHNETIADLTICGYDVSGKKKYYEVIPHISGIFSLAQFAHHIGTLFVADLIQSPCNKLYKSAIIKQHKLTFPIDIHLGEDLSFNLDYLAECRTISLLKQSLYIYNEQDKSLSKQIDPAYFERQHILIEKVKQLLIKYDAYSVENKRALENVFSQVIINTFSQLLEQYNRNKLEIMDKIKQLFTNDAISTQAGQINGSLQAKLFNILIRFKLERTTYLFLNFKDMMKRRNHKLYSFFKATNNRTK